MPKPIKKKPVQQDMLSSLLDSLALIIVDLIEKFVGLIVGAFYPSNNKREINPISIEQIKNTQKSSDPHCLGYSVTKKKDVKFEEIDTSLHNLVIGASGYGKTSTSYSFINNGLKQGKSIISFDPKGSKENIQILKYLCREKGKKLYVFSEYYYTGEKFNLFRGLDVTQSVALIMRSFSWGNDFYKTKSETALYEAISDIKIKNETLSFYTILVKLIDLNDKKDSIGGLISYLQGICFSSFGKCFDVASNADGYSISDIRGEGACLYIGLSTQGYGDIAKGIGRVFLCSLLFHSYSVSREGSEQNSVMLRNHVSVHLDEFGSIIVPDFVDLINKCRSSKIELFMYIQSLADIDVLNERMKRQIFENSNNIIIQKQSSPDDVTFLANSIATIPATKKTDVIEDGVKQSLGSSREAFEYICHPRLFSNLKVGQCILVQHNPKNIELINLNELSDKELLKKAIESDKSKILPKSSNLKMNFGIKNFKPEPHLENKNHEFLDTWSQ